jgi:hypothetical protein
MKVKDRSKLPELFKEIIKTDDIIEQALKKPVIRLDWWKKAMLKRQLLRDAAIKFIQRQK